MTLNLTVLCTYFTVRVHNSSHIYVAECVLTQIKVLTAIHEVLIIKVNRVIVGKVYGRTEVTGRREIRRRRLPDDLKKETKREL